MTSSRKCTRAESTDVANAVFDGADVCGLNAETTTGKYPIQAVEMMSKICAEAERCLNYRRIFERNV